MRKLNILKAIKPKDPVKKNNEKLEKQIKKEQDKKAQTLLVRDLIPVVDFNPHLEVGIMEDGTICDTMQIIGRDLNNASDNELLLTNLAWDKLYHTYPADIKIIAFHFPTDTTIQQANQKYRLDRAVNPIAKKLCAEKLEELENITKNCTDKEYALMIFAKDLTEHKDRYATVYSMLTRSSAPQVQKMSAEKKKWLFYKLNNKNLA